MVRLLDFAFLSTQSFFRLLYLVHRVNDFYCKFPRHFIWLLHSKGSSRVKVILCTRGISLIFAPMFASSVTIQDDGFALGILLKCVARFACPIVLSSWQSQDITDKSVTTVAVGVTFSFRSTRKKNQFNRSCPFASLPPM